MSFYYKKPDSSVGHGELFNKSEDEATNTKKNAIKLSMIVLVFTAALAIFNSYSTSTKVATSDSAVYTPFNSVRTGKSSIHPGDFTTRTMKKFEENVPTATVTVTSPGYSSLDAANYLPWKAIAEPYREQEITLSLSSSTGAKMALKDSGLTVTWSIAGQTYHGTTATFQVDSVGIYECTATVYSVSSQSKTDSQLKDASSVSYTYTFELAVKYIRREIRSLTNSHRETFFNAFVTLYKVNDTVGQAKYGSKYHSMEYFNAKHLLGAGMSDCDHWHDGAGILTHHAAITLAFEQSLQSVDPSISLPYWEYTMDDYLYTNWWESPIFNDDWFGTANPATADHSLATGRFSGIEVPDGSSYTDWSMSSTKSLNPYVNPYGLMRTPWNLNSSPYFGRRNTTWGYESYSTFPTCEQMDACYSHSSYADLFECTNGVTHGPVHILIGGTWSDNEDEEVEYTFMHSSDKILLFKILWRTGFTRCPDTCTVGETCKCAIPDEYFEKYTAKGIVKASQLDVALVSYFTSLDDLTEEEWTTVLRKLENVDSAGEMFTSAATYDPTFWPLHGSIERLVGLKRIVVWLQNDTTFNTTWSYPSYTGKTGMHLDGSCDWSTVSSTSDLTLPTCTFGVTCKGHYSTDYVEFTNFVGESETYTNIEFLNFLHPYNAYLPYIYDSYDFTYCEKSADVDFVDMDEVLTETVNEPSALYYKGSATSTSTTVSASQ